MTPARLANMRRVSERFMDKTCTIARNTAATVKGAPAPATYQPVPPGTPVICMVTVIGSPNEQEIAAQFQGIETYTLTVPFGTDLRRGDRVTIEGAAYSVIGVDQPTSFPVSLDALIQSVSHPP